MSSRFFHFKEYFQYVFLNILVPIFLHLPSAVYAKPDLSVNSGSATTKISVRDFKNYREYLYKNSRILISKNKKNINLHFAKNNANLILAQNKNKKTYDLSKEGKDYKHNVFYKLNTNNTKQVGYYSKIKMKYFKAADRNDDCSVNYKPLLEQMGSKDIVQKIDELLIADLMDKSTCNKIDDDEIIIFKAALVQQFKTKSSSLVSCLTKPEVQKILNQDQFLQNNATAVLARFLNLIDKISNGEKPLQIKCDLEPNEKMQIASYNEKSEPIEISINFKNNKFASTVKKTSNNGKEKADIKTILSHELFHYGAQQYPLGKNQNCLDEGVVQLFDEICTTPDFTKTTFKTSADILNQCASSPDNSTTHQATIQSDKASTSIVHVDTASPAITAALQASTTADQLQQQQITTNLARTTDPEVFTPVADTDVAVLANSALYNTAGVSTAQNYGEQQTIVATPAVRQSLDAVVTALDKTATGMASGLNKAIALTVNPAQAAAGGADYSKQNSVMPVNQVVAEKYSPDFDKPAAAPVVPAPADTTSAAGLAALPAASVRQPASVSADGLNPEAEAAPKATRSIASVGNARAVVVTPAVKPAVVVPAESTKPAATDSLAATSNSGAASNSANISLDNPVLQSLTAFNQMTGTTYQQVAKKYDDPVFVEQLKRRRISIVVVDDKNQPLRKIGITDKAEHHFIDNGKTLTKVKSEN